jgi:SAM-dependent methyltransferase
MGAARKLQLGAFDRVQPGWINTDVTPHMIVARVPGLPWLLHRLGLVNEERYAAYRSGAFRSLRYLDLTRRFPFPDASLDAIYGSHVFEHLHTDVAEHCLRECRRVLRPGGILRIAVPDLDNMVAHYDPDDPDAFLWGIYQGGGSDDMGTARHWWHYNARSLAALLRAVGFSDVRRCEFRQGRLPDVEAIEHRDWSLFMEASR